MSVSVTMPRLGESVSEGTVTRWLKKEGERVEADEPLLEVSTDKVDTEIPAPSAGVLVAIRVSEDVTVDVGTELAVIDETGAGAAAGGGTQAGPEQSGAEGPAAEAPAAEAPAAEAPAAESARRGSARRRRRPPRRRPPRKRPPPRSHPATLTPASRSPSARCRATAMHRRT